MRKIILTSICAISLIAKTKSQNTFPASGNVGVGTTSPQIPIHIVKSGFTFSLTPFLRLDNTQANGLDETGTIRTVWDFSSRSSAAEAGAAGLYIQVGNLTLDGNGGIPPAPTTFTTLVKISPSGNVGIGLSNPLQKLHVNGNAQISGLAGTGNRMVIANANGVLSTQTIGGTPTLTVSNHNLSISGGNTVALPDNQTLSLSGSTLSIAGGNSVNIATSGDNLGNHTATTILNMSTKDITNVGKLGFNNGYFIDDFGGGALYTNAYFGCGGVPSYALDVFGDIRYSGSLFQASDKRFKKEINPLVSSLSKLKSVKAYTYKLNSEEFKEKHFDNDLHTGFIAQEIIEIFPELVKKDEKGFMSINYIEIVPHLVEAIKEQQTLIEELTNRVSKMESLISSNDSPKENKLKGILYQNVPNPFSENTEIKVFIPNNDDKATISFYDLFGKLIKQISLIGAGEQSILVNQSDFNGSLFTYSLTINNQVIDSKKIIINK